MTPLWPLPSSHVELFTRDPSVPRSSVRNALALIEELGPPLDVGVLCRSFGIQYMDT